MLRSTVKLLPFLLLVLLTVNSCKKKNDQKSKTQLITERDWRLTKFEEQENNNPPVDYLTGASACNLDDRHVFKTNNTYEINEGPSKCNPSDPQLVDTGTWSLGDNETKFIYDGIPFTIVKLDGNTLELSYTDNTSSPPDVYKYKVIFVH
nr:lipocalin family protein [uncultured Lacibacter sp.]